MGERLILNNMNNVKENVLIARDMEFRSGGESKHVLCIVHQGLEQCARISQNRLIKEEKSFPKKRICPAAVQQF
ncbi:hypothetical protein VNO80_15763 [Phaseolus coccineus]|uniref:Uncharacterized protein n=1 Tax=Phaseolus coccineus TaxID=3886 RepID=A0AAN9MKF8_PHACN